MFRKIINILLMLPLITFGGLCALGVVAISFEPMVSKQSFSSDSYQRADQWLNHLRSAFEHDQLNRLTLDARDISDLVYYASSRLKVGNKKLVTLVGIRSEFVDDKIITRFTLKPQIERELYLNISLSFSEKNGLPSWDFFEVGNSYWPGEVISWVFSDLLLPNLPESQEQLWQTVTGAVEEFSIWSGKVSLVYRTDTELRSQLKSQAMALMLSSPEERQVLQLYLDVLAASAAQQSGTEIPLSKMLANLFGLAKARSAHSSAVEENGRLLRALAIQVADPTVRALLAPGMKPATLSRPIVLRGRADLTRHFLVSAALALELDEETALNIGVSKERSDAQAGGSGFSMADLVANMAGIRFATAATENEQNARKVQDLVIAQQGEHTFMPRVNWLPPGLSAQSYDDLVRHPLYPAMLDKIVKRLNALLVQSEI